MMAVATFRRSFHPQVASNCELWSTAGSIISMRVEPRNYRRQNSHVPNGCPPLSNKHCCNALRSTPCGGKFNCAWTHLHVRWCTERADAAPAILMKCLTRMHKLGTPTECWFFGAEQVATIWVRTFEADRQRWPHFAFELRTASQMLVMGNSRFWDSNGQVELITLPSDFPCEVKCDNLFHECQDVLLSLHIHEYLILM